MFSDNNVHLSSYSDQLMARFSPIASIRQMNRTTKGTLQIVGGTAAGQIIVILSAPLLSRLYTPLDFGVFTVIFSLVTLATTIMALRFDLAIPLPENDSDGYSVVFLALWCVLVTTLIGAVLAMLLGPQVASVLGQSQIASWLWSVPIVAAAASTFTILNQLAIRQQRYAAIGRRSVLQQLVGTATQIVAGAIHPGPGGLILGTAIGQTAGSISLCRRSGLRSDAAASGRKLIAIRNAATRYRNFPLVLAPSGLVNALGVLLPVILIAYYYGVAEAGLLGLTQRVLSVPMALLGASIAQTYLGELSRRRHSPTGDCAALFTVASRRLLIAGVTFSVPIGVLGPLLFDTFFGSDWAESGTFARALAVSLAAQLLAAPLSQTLVVFEKQTVMITWDVGRLVLVILAIVIPSTSGSSVQITIWSLSLSSTAAYLVLWLASRRTVRNAKAPACATTGPRTA